MAILIGPLIQLNFFTYLFVERYVTFWNFSISSSFGRQLNQNVDERRRRIIYERTLLSLLVLWRVLSSMISAWNQTDYYRMIEFSRIIIVIFSPLSLRAWKSTRAESWSKLWEYWYITVLNWTRTVLRRNKSKQIINQLQENFLKSCSHQIFEIFTV